MPTRPPEHLGPRQSEKPFCAGLSEAGLSAFSGLAGCVCTDQNLPSRRDGGQFDWGRVMFGHEPGDPDQRDRLPRQPIQWHRGGGWSSCGGESTRAISNLDLSCRSDVVGEHRFQLGVATKWARRPSDFANTRQ